MNIQMTLNQYFNEKLSQNIVDTLNEKGRFMASLPFDDEVLSGVAKSINELDGYIASFDIRTLTIAKITYVETVDKLYLRFGLLPENEESYNYITKESENGVSVFELVNNTPVLSNLQLVDSLTGRSDALAFYVTGDLVGTGFDGEPLLKNVKYVKQADIDTLKIGIEALDANFSKKTGNFDSTDTHMHLSFLDGFKVCLGGYTYTEPRANFDIRMGHDRLHEEVAK